MTHSRANAGRSGVMRAILSIGLIAGTLDLSAALLTSTLRGAPPIQLLQSVASGLLGQAAYAGGIVAAALGVVAHYVIATCWTVLFVFAARARPVLVANWPLDALGYGLFVWSMMNFVVLPLSAFPHEIAWTPGRVAISAGVIVCCIGLPIVLLTRRWLRAG